MAIEMKVVGLDALSKIEINDAAITVLKTFSATIPADRAACITTNESSPICVSPAATRIAVLSGYRNSHTTVCTRPETCRRQ